MPLLRDIQSFSDVALILFPTSVHLKIHRQKVGSSSLASLQSGQLLDGDVDRDDDADVDDGDCGGDNVEVLRRDVAEWRSLSQELKVTLA